MAPLLAAGSAADSEKITGNMDKGMLRPVGDLFCSGFELELPEHATSQSLEGLEFHHPGKTRLLVQKENSMTKSWGTTQ